MYRIIVEEVTPDPSGNDRVVEVYRQVVPTVDFLKLTAFVNYKKRKSPTSKQKPEYQL